MNTLLIYLFKVFFLTILTEFLYIKLSKGMAANAIRLQARRFLITSAISLLPTALISGSSLPLGATLMIDIVCLAWAITFPLLYHLTNRKVALGYENQMDIVFAVYCYGWLTGLLILSTAEPGTMLWLCLLAIAEWILLLIPLSLWGYYLLYKRCIDAYGMQLIEDTNYNEIIEFYHSLSPTKRRLLPIVLVAILALSLLLNLTGSAQLDPKPTWPFITLTFLITLFLTYYLWKKRHGVFVRTGAIHLWLLVKDYMKAESNYTAECEKRMQELFATPLSKDFSRPSTLLLVIGESASRDYMSAFAPIEEQTTPWLDRCKKDTDHFILFPHAYSCNMHTVPTLEKALTESNQYNKLPFLQAPSIIDVAHKLGYHVHWYSNQGHLGVNDTPITTIAGTSDVAKWTKQKINRVQYDGSLVSFLNEINPEVNNLLVLHLKGSHFNYENRFPAENRMWGKDNPHDNYTNYINSLHYTDSVLEQFYTYCSSKLNLQAMVYFSDHAADPLIPRFPGFNGFNPSRIPLFVYVSDEYQQLHSSRVEALKKNHLKYFTNDLIYELMCGIFDIRSNHFDESACLASNQYKYTRDTLFTYEGRIPIADDKGEKLLNDFC